MIRAKQIFNSIRERDLRRESEGEPLDEHLKLLYLRGVNKYFKSKTKSKNNGLIKSKVLSRSRRLE